MVDEISLLNSIYNGLSFKEATYVENRYVCLVSFLYNPEIFKPTDENKREILNKLKDIIGDFVPLELDLIKCSLDKHAIANYTYTTIANYFPALNNNFSFDDIKVNIDGMNVTLELGLMKSSYEYAITTNKAEILAKKLQESFLANFIIEFREKLDEVETRDAIKDNVEFVTSIQAAQDKTMFNISDITNIIGKIEAHVAIDYSKISTPIENVLICGEVIRCEKRTYKREYTRNQEKKEVEKIYYTFTIKNDGKYLSCVIFPRQSDELKGDLIEVGIKVCCYGSFKLKNDRLNFTAYSIARCEYSKEEIKSNLKTVNDEYHTVFPKPYVHMEQGGLFDEEEATFDGRYVVFDLETTGLEPNKDKITEVGACKIVNGRITEVFSTFVNPERHIPKEITEKTHITDDMVKDAPTINYILPDFYKFCAGSTLVGHNVEFDLGFIRVVAKKYSYAFDNPTMDTMEMSRRLLPGLKNYKLGTIVERLGLVNEGAHRAVHDSIATAKVFIKLMQKY